MTTTSSGLSEFLSGSLFYPASGLDLDAIPLAGRAEERAIYCDYGIASEGLVKQLEALDARRAGFRVDEIRPVELDALGMTPFDVQAPPHPRARRVRAKVAVDPYAVWISLSCMSTDEGHARRVQILFIAGDGVATFDALYTRRGIAPAGIAIIQPGHGFGGNWTNFESETGPLAEAVLRNPAGTPSFLLHGGIGGASFYEAPCWSAYSQPGVRWQAESSDRVIHQWYRPGNPAA